MEVGVVEPDVEHIPNREQLLARIIASELMHRAAPRGGFPGVSQFDR